MKLVRTLSVLAVATAFAAGCSDTTAPADLTLDDLVGTWVASSFLYQATANPAAQFDLVANGGGFTLAVAASGAVNGSITFPGIGTETFSATATVSNGTFTVLETGEDPMVFTITAYADNTITLRASDEEFDFTLTDGIDNPIPASLTIVATRQ